MQRFLTAKLGVPIATQGVDTEGTLTLWFHENKDKNGEPSDKIYGVSCCHVLRKDSTIDYELRPGYLAPAVRVCGPRRFQRGLDDIKMEVKHHVLGAELSVHSLEGLEAESSRDQESLSREIFDLDRHHRYLFDLESFHKSVIMNWSDINLQRNIGYVEFAPARRVRVEGGKPYTSDWGAFVASEAKVRKHFEGNVVELGMLLLASWCCLVY